MTRNVQPVLCLFDYLGAGRGKPEWFSDSIMVEVESSSMSVIKEEFERRMAKRRATHGPCAVGPRPLQWALRGVLTRDDVQRHH